MDGIDGLEQSISAKSQQAFDAGALKVAQSYAPPSTDTSLADLRWEGMSNAQLAAAVQQLNNGSGAAAMTTAADALANVAADLTQINDALQTQLQAIGVNWQSQTASDLADQMLSASAAYGGTVTDQGGGSSTAINQQAEAYATARNAAPRPQALSGNTAQSNSAMASGSSPFTGHGNDHATQVSQANAARNQAVDAMNNYTSSSQSNLGGYAPPPPPPGIGVGTGPSTGTSTSGYPGPVSPGSPGTPVLGGGGGTSGVGTLPPGVPGGSGGVTGLPGGGVPGAPGTITLGTPGGTSSGVGLPGGGSFSGGTSGGVPGGGVSGGGGSIPPGTASPGPVTGIGPIGGGGGAGGVGGSGPVSRAAGMPAAPLAGAGEEIGEIAAGAAVAGGTAAVGIVGASSRRGGGDEEVTGRDFEEPGGFADDDDDFNPNRSVLAEVDAEQDAAARMNAELSASDPAAPGLLEPALGRRDDDSEHRGSYAATDDEFFDDGRMVIPDVLGGKTDHGRADDDDEDA
jgi:hypothetical protein